MTTGSVVGRPRAIGSFKVLAGVAVVAALAGVGAGPLAAHTDLLQGSPGPAQRVGGTIDFIDLVFVAPVSDVVVEVRGPDGEVVDGEMDVADGQIIRHRMEALTRPGRYLVDYQMISDDGDFTEAGFFFDYEIGAFEPTRLGRVDLPDTTLLTARNLVGAGAVVVLAVACLVLLGRFRRTRAALVAHREVRNP